MKHSDTEALSGGGRFGRTALAGAALAAGGLLYAGRAGARRLVVERVPLVLPRLGPGFDGYRIAQIGDLHLDGRMTRERLGRAVKLVLRESPDLVVVTGDFVTETVRRGGRDLVEALRTLRPPDGVLAVLGNHDYLDDPELVRAIIRDSGATELSNTHRTLRRGESVLHVAGVDDFLQRRARLDLVLRELPPDGAAILLAHEPDFADVSVPTGRFDLQVSGHSHGGQARLPFLGPVVRPLYSRRYPDGLYDLDGTLLYTNRGLGTIRLDLRYNSPPEVTVFTLLCPEAPG